MMKFEQQFNMELLSQSKVHSSTLVIYCRIFFTDKGAFSAASGGAQLLDVLGDSSGGGHCQVQLPRNPVCHRHTHHAGKHH